MRYENFRHDVQDFDAVLHHLETALENAAQRYRQRGASSAINPRDDSFEGERRRLIGNFNATLDEAKTVLAKNRITPQTNAQGVLQSLRWAAGVEDKVNELRRRLQFHSHKMLLCVDRLTLQLMTDTADKLDDLVGLAEQGIAHHERIEAILREFRSDWVAHIQGRLPATIATRPAEPPPIPTLLIQRFESMLSINAPLALVQAGYDAREIPIDEAFDALMVHTTESADAATGSQTPEHYVQLLKATWLVQRLQASQGYQNARPGYYYRRAINQIAQKLSARMRDPRLVSFDVEMLGALSNETYEIWPSPEPEFTISQVDARPGEHEEIRLDLVLQADFTQQRVVVFRRSDSRFRIVQENIREGNGRIEQQIPLSFDMNQDRFIPFYSLPEAHHPAYEIAISNQATGDLESYRFRSKGDLDRFQSILLGQRMVYEDTRVTFKMSDGTEGTGRFQIWQEPVRGRPSLDGHGSSSSSSAMSPTLFYGSRNSSTAGNIAPSTIFEHPEGMEGGSVPLPALVILTKLQGRLAYIYLKLEQGLRVFQEHCECRQGSAGYARCKILSLARERRREFPAHIKYADVDSKGQTIVSSCDLSVFRLPNHPGFKNLRPNMVDNILMTFQSPIAKDAFNLELHQRFDLRDLIIQQHNDYDHVMVVNAERPERILTHRPSNACNRTLTRTMSLAPSVGSLQIGDSFADEMARTTDPATSTPRVRQNNGTVPNPQLTRTNTDLTFRPTVRQASWSQNSRTDPNRSYEVPNVSKQISTSSRFGNLFRLSRPSTSTANTSGTG